MGLCSGIVFWPKEYPLNSNLNKLRLGGIKYSIARLEENLKKQGAKGLPWLRWNEPLESPIAKFLSAAEVKGLREKLGIKTLVPENPRLMAALGAAVIAAEH